MMDAAILCVEVDPQRIERRLASGFLEKKAATLKEALALVTAGKPVSVGLCANAADIYPEIMARGVVPDIVTDQTSAHDLLYGYVPSEFSVEEAAALRKSDPGRLMQESLRSVARHVRAMLAFRKSGAVVFDNGNLIRTQAKKAGVDNAFDIPVFSEAFLRPLFSRGIGPFRWIALGGEPADIARIDDLVLELFPQNRVVCNWIRLARKHVPFQGLPARIAWLGHGERTKLALAVNRLVHEGRIAPIAFTRDHLDAGAMAHPNIMTENMRDGSDAIADWPLLNALVSCASMADLVAIHSGGGGYAGYMTSAGLTLIADGSERAARRLELSLTNDTSTGIMRYADAGYAEALEEAARAGVRHIRL